MHKIKVLVYSLLVYPIGLLLKIPTIRHYVYREDSLVSFREGDTIELKEKLHLAPLLKLYNLKIGRQNVELYYSHESDIPRWRYDTYYTKEPETLEWIDTFEKESVFWDIGANVGVYSLYAAIQKNSTVYSFEPSFVNYYYLCANLVRNKLDEKIQAFPVAFSDSTSIASFNMNSLDAGSAESHFGEKVNEMPFYSQKKVKFRQTVIGFNIDMFVSLFPNSLPKHIKIDVDGLELKILQGAVKTLQDKRLQSLSIELDENDAPIFNQVTSLMKDAGFTLISKRHSAMFDNSSYSSVYNCLFQK